MGLQGLVKIKGINVLPALPAWLAFTQGNQYFVRPGNGSDGNDGLTPEGAFKTLLKAYNTATANQNDIIYLMAESNTAASTTDYQAAALAWAKDLTHLIGIGPGSLFSPRSRIAFTSAYNTAADLMTVSANCCYIHNIEMLMGVAGTAPTGCLTVTGNRNHFNRCHIAGFGGAAGANDIANAYDINLNGAKENLFDDCTVGIDTIQLGSNTNSHLYVQNYATRNVFRGCRFRTYTSSATANTFLRGSATHAIDRELNFDNCTFFNAAAESAGTNMTYAFVLAASEGGVITLTNNTRLYGCTGWIQSGTTKVYSDYGAPTPSNATYGVMLQAYN